MERPTNINIFEYLGRLKDKKLIDYKDKDKVKSKMLKVWQDLNQENEEAWKKYWGNKDEGSN